MKRQDNRIVIDLNKVLYARFYYLNQWGNVRDTLPKKGYFTTRGELYSKTERAFPRASEELTTCLGLATRLSMVDVWVPVVRFNIVANHSLKYTGEKAVGLYREYCARIFKTKKGK